VLAKRAARVARSECVEAVAATEIAGQAGDAGASEMTMVVALGDELYRMLSAMVR
jgi:hypothetical protein